MFSADSLKASLAGGIAGASEACLTMPFEVTKNRLQLKSGPSTIIGSMRSTVAAAGPSGLFYGLQPAIVQVAGKGTIRFAAYERFQAMGCSSFFSGLFAGLIEAMLWTGPTERLKVLRQAEIGVVEAARASGKPVGSNNLSLFAVTTRIIQTQGASSLWLGTGMTAARQATANGVRFALFEKCKASLKETRVVPSSLIAATAGGIIGVVSVIVTNPVDVIKTRVQASAPLNGGNGSSGGSAALGTMEAARALMREGGGAAFAHGMMARTLKIGLGQAVIFGTYDVVRRRLG